MGSFQILHLLAELFDHALELQADIGQLDIVRFGTQRVGLTVEFLGEKIEPAAQSSGSGDDPWGSAPASGSFAGGDDEPPF
jgi:hypothetical protein